MSKGVNVPSAKGAEWKGRDGEAVRNYRENWDRIFGNGKTRGNDDDERFVDVSELGEGVTVWY
jgi:hypothetical protein